MTCLRTVLMVLMAVVVWSGCSAEKASPTKQQPPEQNAISKAMAELPAEDRAAAEKQKVCPVSGEPLGAMGKPYKTTVKGQTVFLCCDGCEDELKKNPEKYLAKLKRD